MRVIHQSQSIDQYKHYPEDTILSYMQVHILVQRFEQSGSVIGRRHGNIGRPKAVRSSESTDQVNSVIKEMHQKSVRRLLSHLTNTVCVSSVYRMLRYDLN